MTDKHVLTFRASPEDEARIDRIAQALMKDDYDVYYNGVPSFQKLVRILIHKAYRETVKNNQKGSSS